MKRVLILIVAVLVGMAAPARAWCEAGCLVPPADAATPHCPTNEPADDGIAITGDVDNCPVVEAARPTTVKIEFVRAVTGIRWHLAPEHLRTPALGHRGPQAPGHLVTIPLRI